MDAEWIFFATSHGKSPCDDVGGFVKHYVVKHSLQKNPKWPIFELSINGWSMCKRNSFHHIFWCKSGRNGQRLHWLGGSLCKVKDHTWNKEYPPLCTNILQQNCSQTHKRRERVFSILFQQSLTREIEKKHQMFFICQLYLQYILVGWHSDWSECTWRWFEVWISSPAWT